MTSCDCYCAGGGCGLIVCVCVCVQVEKEEAAKEEAAAADQWAAPMAIPDAEPSVPAAEVSGKLCTQIF